MTIRDPPSTASQRAPPRYSVELGAVTLRGASAAMRADSALALRCTLGIACAVNLVGSGFRATHCPLPPPTRKEK